MNDLERFIESYDTENTVKNAIGKCLIDNMTTEFSIDILTSILGDKLSPWLFDDGSNVRRDFEKEIRCVLTKYFDV